MGTSKTNISKINKYVKGRLNAQDMHQLERETYDDAFLNEAMEGYEELPGDDHEETLNDLKAQLHKRAAREKKGGLVMWRVLSIAASALVLLGVGYWFLKPDPIKNQITQATKKDSKKQIVVNKPAPQNIIPKERKLIADANIEPKRIKEPEELLKEVVVAGAPSIIYKTDTVEYVASDYKVRANASVDEMLKKAEGFEIDTDGSVTFNGQAVTKARLNGKDYSGGDVNKAIQSLPADIVDKFQVVDDYGDQAGRTGIKSGDANKVLNLTTRSKAQDTTDKPALNMAVNLINTPKLIFKTDTIVYSAADYRVRQTEPIEAKLKKAEGFEVEPDGSVWFQGQAVKRVKINGKDINVVDVEIVTRNLPADVVDNFEVIDDYSNVKVSFKTPVPERVLNFNLSKSGNAVKLNQQGQPTPVTGWKAYQDYLDKNVTVKSSDGIVVLGFLVAPNGKVSKIKVLIGVDATLNKKAVSVLKKGPKWQGVLTPKEVRLTVVFHKHK